MLTTVAFFINLFSYKKKIFSLVFPVLYRILMLLYSSVTKKIKVLRGDVQYKQTTVCIKYSVSNCSNDRHFCYKNYFKLVYI